MFVGSAHRLASEDYTSATPFQFRLILSLDFTSRMLKKYALAPRLPPCQPQDHSLGTKDDPAHGVRQIKQTSSRIQDASKCNPPAAHIPT